LTRAPKSSCCSFVSHLTADMMCLRTAPGRLARQLRSATSTRTNTTLAATVYYRCSYHDGDATALVAPRENVNWTYKELWSRIGSLAGGLKAKGYQQGDVIATDLEHSAANVLLQLAASHNGIAVLTAKNMAEFEELAQMVHVKGAVMADTSSFLGKTGLPVKNLITDLKGKDSEGVTDRSLMLAYYNVPTATSNRAAYNVATGIAGLLEMTPADTICVATSPNHLVGIGSVVSGFVRNATVYLPDLANFDLGDSTLVIIDNEGIDKMREAAKKGTKLRGGVVHGDGDDILWATQDVAGVELRVLGSGSTSEVMRPLYDSCKDTYYSFK